MKRKIFTILASLGIIASSFVITASKASATDYCVGHRGCHSGWHPTVFHDAYDTNYDITISQNVVWWSDDIRTVYYSGSYCTSSPTYPVCHRMDEVRIYWAVPGSGVWTENLRQSPGPNYGTYDNREIVFGIGDYAVKGFWTKFRLGTYWFETQIIYN